MTSRGHRWPSARTLTLAILGLGFVAVLAANLPGQLSYDSVIQLSDGRTGHYHSWHPPIMAWTLGVLDAVLPGPALFVVLDAGLFFASLGALAATAPRVGRPAPVCAMLIALTPLVLIYQGIVWKDVYFADCSVAGFVCLSLSDREGDRRGPGAFALTAAAFVLFGLAALIRQNGAVALAAGTAALAWTSMRRSGGERKRGLGGALLALCLTLAGVFAIGRALDLRRVDEPGAAAQFQALQQYDLVGALAHDRHMDLSRLGATGGSGRSLAEAVKGATRFYSPQRVDTLAKAPGLDQALSAAPAAVSAQWRWMLGHDTGAYLRHRLEVFYWTLSTPGLRRCLPVYTGIDGPPALVRALGLSAGVRPQDAALDRYAARFYGTPVFSHLTYALLALVGAVLMLRSGRAGDAAIGFMLLGALAFCASFLAVSFACDYRYLYALDLSAMTAVFYAAVRGLGGGLGRGRGEMDADHA